MHFAEKEVLKSWASSIHRNDNQPKNFHMGLEILLEIIHPKITLLADAPVQQFRVSYCFKKDPSFCF